MMGPKKYGLPVAAWLFLLACAVILPEVLFVYPPQRDVALRYIPMAEAFARGDWLFAFHPRIPLLHPALAGCMIFLTGMSGFAAVKIAGMLAFAAGVFPLYALTRRIFNEHVAAVTGVMYVFASHLIRLGGSGLRDSLKSFAFLMAAWALIRIWQERRSLSAYLWLGTACAVMLMNRSDSVLYAGLFLLTALAFELYSGHALHVPGRALCACALFLVLISPQLVINYYFAGYPVPDIRFCRIIEKAEAGLGCRSLAYADPVTERKLNEPQTDGVSAPDTELSAEQIPCPETVLNDIAQRGTVQGANGPEFKAEVLERTSFEVPSMSEVLDATWAFLSGFYRYYLVLIAAAIAFRMWKRKWRPEETILLTILLCHNVFLVAQIMIFDRYLFVSSRYLLPVAPLGFLWAGWGVEQLWTEFGRRWPRVAAQRWLAPVLFAVFAVVMLLDGYDSLRKDVCSARWASRRQVAELTQKWLEADYQGPDKIVPVRLNSISYLGAGRPLVVADRLRTVAPLTGGFGISFVEYKLWGHLFAVPADYMVYDSDGPAAEPRGYRKVHEISTERDHVVIYKRMTENKEKMQP